MRNNIEDRLEKMGAPIIILPGKKSRKTLDNWLEKKMRAFPKTWAGFVAYFEKEPAHGGKVDGFIINLCDKTEKYDFKLSNNYYKISPYKIDKFDKSDKFEGKNINKGNKNFENELNKKINIFNAYDYKLGLTKEEILKVFKNIGIAEDIKEKNKYPLLKGVFDFKKKNNKETDNKNENELTENYFNIEGIDSTEILKEKGGYLYFELNKVTGKSKRVDFNNAILNGDFELAKELYLEALNVTSNKLKRVGLTPEQNKFVIDCFRNRNYKGIKKILEETKNVVGENMQVEDTVHKYSKVKINQATGQKEIEYDNKNKTTYKDPITGKEVLMTRKELHERIIEKFLLDGEASKGEKELILSGGLPGAGKSTIEEALKNIPKVIINPDLVKDYLPEYYDEQGRKFGAEIVHEESSYISKLIYERAIIGGYTILYDSSMKDKPSEGFPKYDKIVETAHRQGYQIEARFIYDGGEARYRNTVLRERSMGLKNYNSYGSAYKTIEYLSKDKRVNKVIIYDNSGNGRISQDKIVYENQNINMEESDANFIKRFNDYQTFLDELL